MNSELHHPYTFNQLRLPIEIPFKYTQAEIDSLTLPDHLLSRPLEVVRPDINKSIYQYLLPIPGLHAILAPLVDTLLPGYVSDKKLSSMHVATFKRLHINLITELIGDPPTQTMHEETYEQLEFDYNCKIFRNKPLKELIAFTDYVPKGYVKTSGGGFLRVSTNEVLIPK